MHYPDPLYPLATYVLRVAENADRVLRRDLQLHPTEMTHIVLTDGTDFANGFANVVPRNMVQLYAAPPEDLSTLSDNQEWIAELVTHEYTHVVHLDQMRGVHRIINAILGKTSTPQQTMPRWLIEGLATYHETADTGGGRLRSSIFEMYLRSDLLADNVPTLAQISNEVDRWPQGNIWYLYGSNFVQYLVDTYGIAAMRQVLVEYATYVIPFGLNRVFRHATGKGIQELYSDFVDTARDKARSIGSGIREAGVIEGRAITHVGEDARAPRFISEDSLLYWGSDGRSQSGLWKVNTTTLTRTWFARADGTVTVSPGPGERLFMSAIDDHADQYSFHDLFSIGRDGSDVHRLTHGLRAMEPDLSPDGRQIVFRTHGAGTSHLMIADVADIEGTRRVLVRSAAFDQVYSPRWAPDGKKIVFSRWTRHHGRDIEVLHVSSGVRELVTHDAAFDMGPCFSPDGRYIYFSSDRSGISNIYRYQWSSGRTERITNVLGGAFQPALSPSGDELVYLGYTTRGFDLFAIDLTETQGVAEPPVEASPSASAANPALSESEQPLTRRYSPLRTILPRAYMLEWVPGVMGDEIGVTFLGGDVLGQHAYAGRIGVPFVHPDPNVDLSYTFSGIRTPLSLHFSRAVSERNGFQVEGERRTWLADARNLDVSTAYSFRQRYSSHTFSASYSVNYIGLAEPHEGKVDANDPPPVFPRLGWNTAARVGWGYSTVDRHGYDISASAGESIGLRISFSDPAIGSRESNVALSWSLARYVEMPWLRHHVLAIRVAGGIAGGKLGPTTSFGVGGFPDSALLDAIRNELILGGVALRGYAPSVRTGSQYHLGQLEYRLPVWNPNFGVETLPLYLRRIHALAFADYGNAFNGVFKLSEFLFGAGLELHTEWLLGYSIPIALRTGLAYGFGKDGELQGYANIGVPF